MSHPRLTPRHPVLEAVPSVDTEGRLPGLRRFNLVMSILHAVSGIAMLALSNDFALGVTTFFVNGPPGTPIEEGLFSEAFTVPIGPATAGFLLLSALFHLIIVVPGGFAFYGRELSYGRNRIRWVEYSLSSTLMILLISIVSGLTDLAALIAIAAANISMILFGWIMEMVNDSTTGNVWWSPFWFGCVAGLAPWLGLVAYLWVNVNQLGAEGPPTFVYGILFSIFFFFNCFAINQWLQYKRIGRWRDYLFGERTYIVLSLVAKSALAWQVFANTLID